MSKTDDHEHGHDYDHNHEHDHSHEPDHPHAHTHAPQTPAKATPEPDHPHAHIHANTKAVLNRLARAIGHLTSVRGMVERGQDCSEVLIQLAAVRSAINRISEVILKDHLDHCIVDAVKTGDTQALDELNRAIEIMMK